MHKVDGPGATAENEFTEGDPQTPVPATTVPAKWLNTVQRELVAVVEEAGITLDDEDDGQLLAALLAGVGVEFGTWTPVFRGTSAPVGQSYSVQSGIYAKLGRLVFCSFYGQLSAAGSLGSGQAEIHGLPFAIDSDAGNSFGVSLGAARNLGSSCVAVMIRGDHGTSKLVPELKLDDGASSQAVTPSEMWTDTTLLRGSFFYFAAP